MLYRLLKSATFCKSVHHSAVCSAFCLYLCLYLYLCLCLYSYLCLYLYCNSVQHSAACSVLWELAGIRHTWLSSQSVVTRSPKRKQYIFSWLSYVYILIVKFHISYHHRHERKLNWLLAGWVELRSDICRNWINAALISDYWCTLLTLI